MASFTWKMFFFFRIEGFNYSQLKDASPVHDPPKYYHASPVGIAPHVGNHDYKDAWEKREIGWIFGLLPLFMTLGLHGSYEMASIWTLFLFGANFAPFPGTVKFYRALNFFCTQQRERCKFMLNFFLNSACSEDSCVNLMATKIDFCFHEYWVL